MTAPRQSLFDSIARRTGAVTWRRPSLPAIDVRFAFALTALIALGPLLTIAGAGWLRADAQRDAEALRAQGQARFDAEGAQRSAALQFRDAVRRPTVAVTLDRIARVVPDDARLAAVAREADGTLRIEIATSDPDPLRTALRRDPLFAAMRETGQRRTADGRVVVVMRTQR
ncbi:hypothetical protein ABS767_16870 [Sphingomonas sp. ST-64]|uniref:Uncharacterized protein n=1 Tax=Sphingomonas plantiphila TaxID=3163295 RepID=A0ABW8YQS5_9SPHN